MTKEQNKFLRLYKSRGSITAVCRKMMISEHKVGCWRSESKEFAAALHAAQVERANARKAEREQAKHKIPDLHIPKVKQADFDRTEKELTELLKQEGGYEPWMPPMIRQAAQLQLARDVLVEVCFGNENPPSCTYKMLHDAAIRFMRALRELGITNESKEHKSGNGSAFDDFLSNLDNANG